MPSEIILKDGLLPDLRSRVEQARQRAAVAVNRELVLLYWDIGQRIRVEILGEERAEYGERIVQTLSGQLSQEFGKGFSAANLLNMVKFAEHFPDRTLVEKFCEVLSWSHFVQILSLREPLERAGLTQRNCRGIVHPHGIVAQYRRFDAAGTGKATR